MKSDKAIINVIVTQSPPINGILGVMWEILSTIYDGTDTFLESVKRRSIIIGPLHLNSFWLNLDVFNVGNLFLLCSSFWNLWNLLWNTHIRQRDEHAPSTSSFILFHFALLSWLFFPVPFHFLFILHYYSCECIDVCSIQWHCKSLIN